MVGNALEMFVMSRFCESFVVWIGYVRKENQSRCHSDMCFPVICVPPMFPSQNGGQCFAFPPPPTLGIVVREQKTGNENENWIIFPIKGKCNRANTSWQLGRSFSSQSVYNFSWSVILIERAIKWVHFVSSSYSASLFTHTRRKQRRSDATNKYCTPFKLWWISLHPVEFQTQTFLTGSSLKIVYCANENSFGARHEPKFRH